MGRLWYNCCQLVKTVLMFNVPLEDSFGNIRNSFDNLGDYEEHASSLRDLAMPVFKSINEELVKDSSLKESPFRLLQIVGTRVVEKYPVSYQFPTIAQAQIKEISNGIGSCRILTLIAAETLNLLEISFEYSFNGVNSAHPKILFEGQLLDFRNQDSLSGLSKLKAKKILSECDTVLLPFVETAFSIPRVITSKTDMEYLAYVSDAVYLLLSAEYSLLEVLKAKKDEDYYETYTLLLTFYKNKGFFDDFPYFQRHLNSLEVFQSMADYIKSIEELEA